MIETGLILITVGYFIVKFFGNPDWTDENKVYNLADHAGATMFIFGTLLSTVGLISFVFRAVFN